jgi:hypothetical protein
MLASKERGVMTSNRGFHKELKYLYERRVAVEALIRSLEEYQRFHPKREVHPQRRTSA